MSTPTLAVVMAHYDDFNGAYFSIQHLRIAATPATEFVILDNSAAAKPVVHDALRDFCSQVGAKLVAAPHLDGTSQTRNAAIAAARADIVICMDCHVLLRPGAEAAVIKYFSDPANQKNILSGPMLMDHLDPKYAPTHFNPQWNDQMWGRWGTIWASPEGDLLTVVENTDTGEARVMGFNGSLTLPPAPEKWRIKGMQYARHEDRMQAFGCRTWMEIAAPEDTVEIPGMGLGCFAVWRENWLGFHPAASGFGGEELAIHEAYRQNGGKAVCMSAFQWGHRFFRGTNSAAPYPMSLWKKVRNNVLWYQQLGLDLMPVHNEFVVRKRMSQSAWDRLVADPVGYDEARSPDESVYRNSGLAQPPNADTMSLEELIHWTSVTARDLNDHVVYLAQLASKCDSVAEFSGRRESAIALLTCVGPIHSYNDEADDEIFKTVKRIVAGTSTPGVTRTLYSTRIGINRSLIQPLPEPVDLLFLDTEHNGERVTAELDFHAKNVKRYIVFHDTELYGEVGDNGSGMAAALEEWVEKNPEWFVLHHTSRQYGLTVLCRDPAEKPKQFVFIAPPGPGTELGRSLKALGITLQAKCDCRTRMNQMNQWGSAGCREHFDEIMEWMHESKQRWGIEAGLMADGVGSKLNILATGLKSWEGWKIGAKALMSGTVDPVEAIVKLAISRAEAKGF